MYTTQFSSKAFTRKKISSISGEWLLHLLLKLSLSVAFPLQLTLKFTPKKIPCFPVPITAGYRNTPESKQQQWKTESAITFVFCWTVLDSTHPTLATWVGAFSFRAHPTYNWHCLIWQAASLQAHGATFGSNRYFAGWFSPCRLCWHCQESPGVPAAATLQQQPRFTQRLALKGTALHTHYSLCQPFPLPLYGNIPWPRWEYDAVGGHER